MKIYTILLVVLTGISLNIETTSNSLIDNYNISKSKITFLFFAYDHSLSIISDTEYEQNEIFCELIEQEEKILHLKYSILSFFTSINNTNGSFSNYLNTYFYIFKHHIGRYISTPIFIALQDFRL